MTWHLKDQELERVLEEYSDGNFVKALNIAIERDWIDAANVVTVGFERKFLLRGYTNDLSFRTDELEEVAEYNPHAWNEYPKVTPSENIPMRVETESGGYIYRECAIFNEGVWKCERDGNADEELYGHVKRFRPWED